MNNNLTFQTDIKISEDFRFIVEYLYYAKKISIVPENLYRYYVNDNSVTVSYIPSMYSDMKNINDWMSVEILPKYPSIEEGLECCKANTYLGFIQNLCRNKTPFKLTKRIKLVYKKKREDNYSETIRTALKIKGNRKKAKIAYILFKFNLEWLYILLFSFKEKTIF